MTKKQSEEKQGKWERGIWYPDEPRKPKNPNRKGYNGFKKNPEPLETSETIIEEFAKKTPLQQKEEIGKMGNELYMKKKELRPLQWKFTRCKDYYDRKHFGWKFE